MPDNPNADEGNEVAQTQDELNEDEPNRPAMTDAGWYKATGTNTQLQLRLPLNLLKELVDPRNNAYDSFSKRVIFNKKDLYIHLDPTELQNVSEPDGTGCLTFYFKKVP